MSLCSVYILYEYIQKARWFQVQDDEKKTNRYELVDVVDYVDYNGVKKTEKKYVDIRRMNHQIWKQPIKLTSGLLKIKDYAKLKQPITVTYAAADMEWFVQWGMDSFLKYNAQVM